MAMFNIINHNSWRKTHKTKKTPLYLWLSFFFLNSLFGAYAQDNVFINTALDNKESPYIERIVTEEKDNMLILRFEGNLNLGKQKHIKQSATGLTFDSAANQLVVIFDNDKLAEETVSIGASSTGDKLVVSPNIGTVQVDSAGVNLLIPLKWIEFSPTIIHVFTHSLYYGKDNMLAREGRNLFSIDGGSNPIINSAVLKEKPGIPEIENLQTKTIWNNSVKLSWSSSHRVKASVSVLLKGKEIQHMNLDNYSQAHQLTINSLIPATEYTIVVSGTTIKGVKTADSSITFSTKEASTQTSANDSYWLSVKGKYIVDAQGNPFVLGGYSHYLGEYWYNTFPNIGTVALAARYYRSVGFNTCRLGLCGERTDSWSASVMRNRDPFEFFGGAEGYVKKLVRPLVDQITAEGVYVVIDWHSSYGLTEESLDQIASFWEACAKEFKDDPKVAMYQLLNEPCFVDGQNRPDLAPRIRAIMKRYIDLIRAHDKRHIIMVSDWNCGWGAATESQWAPVQFDPGDPAQQIVYSKHVSKEHMTDSFFENAINRVSDKWDVPLFFDEVESGQLMNSKSAGWFYNTLYKNPRKYGFLVWVCGQYPTDFAQTSGAFSLSYLSKPPFQPIDTDLISQWWRVKGDFYSTKETQKGKRWIYSYKFSSALKEGDYGIVVEALKPGGKVAVIVREDKPDGRTMGTWIGGPGRAIQREVVVRHGQSAVNGAVYWHAVKPFKEVIILVDKDLKDWTDVQIFQLNPRDQMPVPEVNNPYVDILPASWSIVEPVVTKSILYTTFNEKLKDFKFFNGIEFKGASGFLSSITNRGQDDQSSLELHGDFTKGGIYVSANCYVNEPIAPDSIDFWVKSDDVDKFSVRLQDSTGQVFQQKLKLNSDNHWHKITLTEFTKGKGFCRWGGANDGKLHPPLKIIGILLDKSNCLDNKKTGSICIDVIRVSGKEMKERQ